VAMDWLLTVRQALPHVIRLGRHMRPTLDLPGVHALELELLSSLGIEGVIWDVDGTLMPRHGREVAAPLRPAFQRVVSAPGLRHAILSNADERRYRELGTIFPDIPIVRGYTTAHGVVGKILLGGTDSWVSGGAPVGAPPAMHALRKPSAELIGVAVAALGVQSRDAVLMVGDQYLTDIAGANLGGIRSLKVPTYAPDSFPMSVRVLQALERLWYRAAHTGGSPTTAP